MASRGGKANIIISRKYSYILVLLNPPDLGLKSVIKLCTVTVGILGGYFVSICIVLVKSAPN